MDYKREILKNGIGFTLITDEKFKTDVTYAAFKRGNGVKNAAYSLLLAGVLSRSCEKYPSLYKLNRRLDALYDAQLDCDSRSVGLASVPIFHIRSLNNRYSYDGTDIRKGALDVLYDTITAPKTENGVFSKSDVRGEKLQLIDHINGIKDDPCAYADRRCLSFLFKDDPRFSPRGGTVEAIEEADASSLTEYYRDMLAKSPAEIVCVSDGYHPEFEKFASDLAEKLGGGANESEDGGKIIARGDIARMTETLRSRQGAVRILCDTGDDPSSDRGYVLNLFNEIFAGSAVSRLFKNVREKLSLCYSCGADRYGGLHKLVIRADAESANLAACEAEILRQLELMKEKVSEKELEEGKRSLCEALLSSADSPNSTALWYLIRTLRGLEPLSREEYAEKVNSVTAEEITRAAENIKVEAVYTLKEAENE